MHPRPDDRPVGPIPISGDPVTISGRAGRLQWFQSDGLANIRWDDDGTEMLCPKNEWRPGWTAEAALANRS